MLKIAEEGMDEYWRVLEDWDAKGEIYMADLNPILGTEQSGHRPVVIISW